MSLPKVSIISPTYNHEKFIEECIKSVLSQTYKYWEMIIIDDGSVDRTRDIIQGYDDPRIIFVQREHRGIDYLGDNYNHALQIAKGEFILILEGDDFIPPRRIETQRFAFEDDEVVLSHGKYAYVWNDRTLVYPTPFKEDLLNNQPLGLSLSCSSRGSIPSERRA